MTNETSHCLLLGVRGCVDKLTSIGGGEFTITPGKNVPSSEIIEFMDFHNFLGGRIEALISVVSDLYKDPANMYIPLFQIFEISYQKLVGKTIEPLLQKARKEALQNQ